MYIKNTESNVQKLHWRSNESNFRIYTRTIGTIKLILFTNNNRFSFIYSSHDLFVKLLQ